MVAKGVGQRRTHQDAGGGSECEVGVGKCQPLHIGWIHNKVLLNSTENSLQYSTINHNGKEYIIKRMYVCITASTLLYSKN